MSWNSSGKSKGATPVPVLYARTRRSIAERKKAEREALGPVLFYGGAEKRHKDTVPSRRKVFTGSTRESHSDYLNRRAETIKREQEALRIQLGLS